MLRRFDKGTAGNAWEGTPSIVSEPSLDRVRCARSRDAPIEVTGKAVYPRCSTLVNAYFALRYIQNAPHEPPKTSSMTSLQREARWGTNI